MHKSEFSDVPKSRLGKTPTLIQPPPTSPRFAREVPERKTQDSKTAEVVGPSLQESVCNFYNLQPRMLEDFILDRALYRRARMLRPIIQFFTKTFFDTDRDFIERVAKVHNVDELKRELEEFFYHPGNNGWLRGSMKFRVSSRRLVALVREVMPQLGAPGSVRVPAAEASIPPFSAN